jgi:hypothetical protein
MLRSSQHDLLLDRRRTSSQDRRVNLKISLPTVLDGPSRRRSGKQSIGLAHSSQEPVNAVRDMGGVVQTHPNERNLHHAIRMSAHVEGVSVSTTRRPEHDQAGRIQRNFIALIELALWPSKG